MSRSAPHRFPRAFCARRRGAAQAAEPLGIGHTISPQDFAAWDIDVRGDGAGLPDGRGSVAQG